MERAILVRHGESERNAAGTIGGDPPLSVVGRAQAEALAGHLPPVTLAVTSGLCRAEQTARLAAPTVPRLTLPDLREIHFGRYEGGPIDAYLEWAWAADPEQPCPGGGESRTHALQRHVRGWKAILARPEQTILVVAHGLTIRYVLDALEAKNPTERAQHVPAAIPHPIERQDLTRGVERLEAWLLNPHW